MMRAMVLVAVIVTCAAAMGEQDTAGSPQVQPETAASHPKSRQDARAWIDKLWYLQRDTKLLEKNDG